MKNLSLLKPLAATTSGTAYTITTGFSYTSLTAGDRFTFQADADNSPGQTLTVDSVATKTLYYNNSTLFDSIIPADAIVEVMYDGTNFRVIKL